MVKKTVFKVRQFTGQKVRLHQVGSEDGAREPPAPEATLLLSPLPEDVLPVQVDPAQAAFGGVY